MKDVRHEELVTKINVQVRVISANSDLVDISEFRFDINDNLEKILVLMSLDQTGGQLIHNRRLFTKDRLEKSFAKNFIMDNSKFTLMQTSGGGAVFKEALKWVRF